ncbi:TetR/AcrR family transcriptional regulator [Methylobacterium sp. C1]|uniref:TetR/AcrR family transcriptional regulator n=1 Tax=Methylobacterium sp. C1 TaxID=1479019 RepID=UPI0008D9650B|nr:TetR/AcrR family transcriptional regulator [Methylobacterium sp. C1]
MNGSVTKRASRDGRRAAMLDAAAAVFFDQGYAATSIDAIIERVGGSKRNIYNEFGSKEGLFTALVSENADAILAALPAERSSDSSLDDLLHEFGRQLMTVYMSPALLGTYRAVMAEASRFPALARSFYEKGPGRAADRLAEVLADAGERGEIGLDDFATAANHFVGMLRDNLHLQVVLGMRPPLSPAEIETSVTTAVGIFLDGVKGKDRSSGGGPRARTSRGSSANSNQPGATRR